MKFVVFLEQGRWVWELRSPHGTVVARCAMSFASETNAFSDIQALRRDVPRALVFDLLGRLREGI